MEPTADNSAAAPASGVATTGNVSSGTASEAMVKAAEAASSAESTPAGVAGDTSKPTGTADPGATVGAKTPPASTGPADPAAANRGPVPLDRHEAAVRNAREKGATEARAEFAWAKDIPQEARSSVSVALNILSQMRGDTRDFVTRLAGELGLAVVPKGQGPAGGGNTTATDEALPEPDLESSDGKMKAYSSGTVLKAIDIAVNKALGKLRGELEPSLSFIGTEQEKAEARDLQQRNSQSASSILTGARELPHFKENEKDIHAKLKDMSLESKRQLGPAGALYRAYNLVMAEKVLPTLSQSSEQKVREENARKAAASRGAHPIDSGSDGKAPVLRDGDVGGLARHMEQLAQTSV